MGLKTKNYEVKSMGLTLSEAYALIKSMTLSVNGQVEVTFGIHASRESARTFAPLETRKLTFQWDRKCDVAKKAYEEATKQITTEEVHPETKELKTFVKDGIFYGWEDDIVEAD